MKTKKLELKHLAAYLPYKLQATNKIDNATTYIGEKPPYYYTVIGIKYATEDVIFIDLIINDNKYYTTSHIDFLMPILRPISDLEKIHIFDGTKYPFYLYFWDVTENIEDNFDYAELIIEDCNLENIENYPYNLIQKLLEYHFDIFGLIQSGLAIDINTLNTAK